MHGVTSFRWTGILGVVAALFWLHAPPSAGVDLDDFAGTNLLTGSFSLKTGSGSVLLRTNLPWSAPTNLTHPALAFAFGFGSDDVFTNGEFFDSFTLTVRNEDSSFVAPILTADLFGVTLAPSNPDGTQFDESDVQTEELLFPPLATNFRFQQAFLVLVELPPALAGQSGTVGLSLFDNLNGRGSLGFISHLAVVPGPRSLLVIESSASVAGPYAREDGVSVRHARRCLTLPFPGVDRFYRLRAAAQSRITDPLLAGGDWLFHYTGAAGQIAPILESSAQAAGPYAVESGVNADTATKTLRHRQEGAARFFRIGCEIPLRIRSLRREAHQMVIQYEEPRQ